MRCSQHENYYISAGGKCRVGFFEMDMKLRLGAKCKDIDVRGPMRKATQISPLWFQISILPLKLTFDLLLSNSPPRIAADFLALASIF